MPHAPIGVLRLAASVLLVLPLAAQTDATGTWQVDGPGPSFPWTLTLEADGRSLTGMVRNCSSNQRSSPLADGVVDGRTIRFTCTSDDGNRTIAFTGTFDGDAIAFTWQKTVKPGASPNPRDGMFGVDAPPRFTARRVSTTALRRDPSPRSIALQDLLDARDYSGLARTLPQVLGELRPEERLYFRGMRAYLEGRFADAVGPLTSAINTPDYALTSVQVAQGLETLGDGAMKTFRYADAVRMYDMVERIFGARMGGAIGPIQEKRAVAAALEGVPPQAARLGSDFTLERTGLEYPIGVGGRASTAMLDTAAAVSLVAESTAAAWGLARLEGTVTLRGIGGGALAARPAVLPTLTIGSAELRNVVVFVTDDRNMILSRAILGYPVVSALGRLTVGRDRKLTVSAESPAAAETDAPLWASYSTLLVGASTAAGGPLRTFSLDTGALSTLLTQRYLAEHSTEFPGAPAATVLLAGIDGVHAIPAHAVNGRALWFGASRVALDGKRVLAAAYGGDADRYFGIIGQDVLQQLASYTIDVRTMRLSVRP